MCIVPAIVPFSKYHGPEDWVVDDAMKCYLAYDVGYSFPSWLDGMPDEETSPKEHDEYLLDAPRFTCEDECPPLDIDDWDAVLARESGRGAWLDATCYGIGFRYLSLDARECVSCPEAVSSYPYFYMRMKMCLVCADYLWNEATRADYFDASVLRDACKYYRLAFDCARDFMALYPTAPASSRLDADDVSSWVARCERRMGSFSSIAFGKKPIRELAIS